MATISHSQEGAAGGSDESSEPTAPDSQFLRPAAVVRAADPRFFALRAPRIFDSLIRASRWRETRSSPSPALAILIVALLIIVELVVPNGSRWPQLAWVILFGAEIAAVLVLPPTLWARLCRASAVTDDLLDPVDNAELATWLKGKMKPPLHLPLCVLGAVVGVAGGLLASPHLRHPFSVASIIALGVLGFLGFDIIRWILRAPMVLLFLRERARTRDLRINVLAPPSTQAIRTLNDLLNQASMQTALGLALLATPVVWSVLDSGTPKNRLALVLLSLGPMTVSLAAALYVTFVPQTWLSDILRRHQLRQLDQLGQDDILGRSPVELVAQIDGSVRLFQAIAAAPTRIPSLERTARNATKVLVAVLPYGVTVAIKLIEHARL